jgi:hypothetical protein
LSRFSPQLQYLRIVPHTLPPSPARAVDAALRRNTDRIRALSRSSPGVDLEKRLHAGPLDVRTAWSTEKTARLAPQVLLRRRRRFFVRGVATALGTAVMVVLAFLAGASSHRPRTLVSSGLELSERVERARRLAPRGALTLDALAREIELRNRAGQPLAAQRLARIYLYRFPEGPHAPKLREMLAAP